MTCNDVTILIKRGELSRSGVGRWPLLGGSKCTISMGRAIGGMEFVRCTEVVRSSECPLLEVYILKVNCQQGCVKGQILQAYRGHSVAESG